MNENEFKIHIRRAGLTRSGMCLCLNIEMGAADRKAALRCGRGSFFHTRTSCKISFIRIFWSFLTLFVHQNDLSSPPGPSCLTSSPHWRLQGAGDDVKAVPAIMEALVLRF